MSYRRNNKEKNRWLPWAMIFFGLFSGVFPLVIVGGIMAFVNYKEDENANYTHKNRNYRSNSSSSASSRPYNSTQIQKVNQKLRHYFSDNVSLPIMNDVNLRLRASTYSTLSSLIVYRGDQYICSLNEFGTKYPDMYNQIIKLLIAFSELPDEQVNLKKEELNTAPTATVKPEKQESVAPKFIQQVNDLNTAIPDEEITTGLYETAALLKQISVIEEKFPESKPKLEKLYTYYLPILIDILNQYKDLQSAQADANFKATQERLRKTITLINDAMKTLTASLCEEDFINLKADMSTLESLLQKDGLTNDNKITLKL